MAFVFALPALLLEIMEKGRVKNAPLLIDVKRIFGFTIRHKHEVFLIGLLMHIIIGFFFGLVYVLFVLQGWLFVTGAPYTLLSLIVYAFLSWIVAGVAIYPMLGMGFFGLKEGHQVWMEMLMSHMMLGLGLWLLVQYYQPFFFQV